MVKNVESKPGTTVISINNVLEFVSLLSKAAMPRCAWIMLLSILATIFVHQSIMSRSVVTRAQNAKRVLKKATDVTLVGSCYSWFVNLSCLGCQQQL